MPHGFASIHVVTVGRCHSFSGPDSALGNLNCKKVVILVLRYNTFFFWKLPRPTLSPFE